MIDPDQFAALLDPADPALTIYFPALPEQRDQRAPEARFRQAVEDAAARLAAHGVAEARREALIASARDAGQDFTRHRDPTLALFLSDARQEVVALPAELPSLVVVGRHFHIKPLLPLLARHRRFHLLALSSGNIRLLTATPFAWTEQELTELPLQAQAELDSLPAVGGSSREEARRQLLVEDARRVSHAVRAVIGTDTAPLLLAAEPHVAGHFAKSADLPQGIAGTVAVNPFALGDAELVARAVAVLEPSLDAEVADLLDRVNARLGTAEPTVAIRLEEILSAAHEGRVDALAVAADEILWGRWQPGETLVAHGHEAEGDEDLLNLAAVAALRTGARAYAVPRTRLPRDARAAAILRF